MKYFQLKNADGKRLGVELEEGIIYDITSVHCQIKNLGDLFAVASVMGEPPTEITKQILENRDPDEYSLPALMKFPKPHSEISLLKPFNPPEVWGAGVTYQISEQARGAESKFAKAYQKAYEADRPEVYFKATAERCVGPFGEVGIRGDSNWNVPEPELTFILYNGEIIGYTGGNDMSSRSIEGENTLYVPQAKIYNKCCAIGPCVVTTETVIDPHSLKVRCEIKRNENVVFSEETSTSNMVRTCHELAGWLTKHNNIPDMSAMLTGTSIVPPDDFSLQDGDIVSIEFEKIGKLVNRVVQV